MRLKDLNGFNLTAVALLVIAIIGMVRGNRWLSEPGMPVNTHGWQVYLLAAVIMFINGVVSARLARAAEAERRVAEKRSDTGVPNRRTDERSE